MTVRDSYTLPSIEECLDNPGDASVFYTLDVNARYRLEELEERDRGKKNLCDTLRTLLVHANAVRLGEQTENFSKRDGSHPSID